MLNLTVMFYLDYYYFCYYYQHYIWNINANYNFILGLILLLLQQQQQQSYILNSINNLNSLEIFHFVIFDLIS